RLSAPCPNTARRGMSHCDKRQIALQSRIIPKSLYTPSAAPLKTRNQLVVDRGRSVGMLADHWAGRAGSVFRRSRPDQPDAAHGVQAGVAADGRSDGIGDYADGP